MKIEKNTVVTVKLQVFDPEGKLIDDGQHPMVYLHGGYHGIFPKLEEALQGRDVGESFEIKLTADDAFGEYDESLVNIEPLSAFPNDVEVGMQFERSNEGEEDSDGLLYTITEIADGKVVVDGNHPLAGVPLHLKVTVWEVRVATRQEVAHGHVHGPDGHQHH